MASEKRLVEVVDLKTYFDTDEGTVKAVDGVSFHIDKGETLAVVGESGSGKSVMSLSVMRLIPVPPGRIAGGRILFEGQDLVKKSERDMRRIRGNEISMIFQEPMTSLNPVFTVGDQILEALMLHTDVGRAEGLARTVEMLRKVGIPDPEQRVGEYPHQMSGGMRQRVMIAMALVCGPELLIADEPTTALDVTIQAQILDLLRGLQDDIGMSMLLITHDLGVVAEVAHHVAVMYLGRIVEEADIRELFDRPLHPYTVGLFRSRPTLRSREKLATIPGQVPSPLAVPPGCPFHPRCPLSDGDRCERERPPLSAGAPDGHPAACWYSGRVAEARQHGKELYKE